MAVRYAAYLMLLKLSATDKQKNYTYEIDVINPSLFPTSQGEFSCIKYW